MVKRLDAALEPSARGVVSPFLLEAGVALGVIALLVLAEVHLDGAPGLAVRAAVVVALGVALLAAARRLRLRAQVVGAIAQGLDGLGEAVLVVDRDSCRILHASPAAAGVYGRPAEALIGLDARDLAVSAADRETVEERRRLRAAGHRLPGRTTMAVADPAGRERHVEWATVPLEAGSLLSIARDVTPRIAAERRLAEESRIMASAFDAAAQPIAVLDAQGAIARVNAAAARLAGRDAAALAGRTPWDAGLMTRGEADEVRTALLAGRDPVQHDLTWRVPDGGERVVAWSSTATRDAAGAIRSIVAVGRDLTGQRAAEARARRAHAALDLRSRELERSNADLAEFAALASDDLRAPIHAVRGFADLLEADAAPVLAPRDRSYLTALREAAGHAEEMLDGLAAYGRLAHGEALARDVDCDRTLDAVLDDLAEELEARDAVVTRAPLPVVPGDPEELRTLFSNLIANAVRHGGVERPQLHVGAERRGLGWQLSFADDGDGVPPAERQRIFQLFRRLHPRGAHRGSGVGLALCRRIVERHGGAIWVDEAERGGSVFCVSLPDREAR